MVSRHILKVSKRMRLLGLWGVEAVVKVFLKMGM